MGISHRSHLDFFFRLLAYIKYTWFLQELVLGFVFVLSFQIYQFEYTSGTQSMVRQARQLPYLNFQIR